MTPPKILITGATGYIGGSFVTHIRASKNAFLGSAKYFILLRSSSQAALFTKLDVMPVILQHSENLTELRDVASNYDIVINFAYISLPEHAKALVLGLGDRKNANSGIQEPVFIQASSGTSNVADRPFTVPDRFNQLGLPVEFTDLDSKAIYEAEKRLEAEEAYPLRTTELAIIDTGLELGVMTHVVMIPTVFGAGTGPGNKLSIQIPLLIKSVLKNGYLAVAGEGNGLWDRVHIQDVVDLLTILLTRVIKHEQVPSGKDGIVFSGTSRNSWADLEHAIINKGVKLGKLSGDTHIKHVELAKAEKYWGLEGVPGLAELGFASNSRTLAERAKQWGWVPKFLGMEEAIGEDWLAITMEP
ncbi:Nn.00g029860.m01.CDS01 [Neocucurbitaria sp. VM-36]